MRPDLPEIVFIPVEHLPSIVYAMHNTGARRNPGSFRLRAEPQSTYLVESCFARNARPSSSDRHSGIGLFFRLATRRCYCESPEGP